MSRKIMILIAAALLAFAGCKDANPALNFDGTYVTATGGAYTNTFNQLVIQASGNNSLRIYADTVLATGAFYTYTTIQNCAVQSATAATFNETDSVLGFNHPLLLTGTATLNGSTITFQGTGINAYDTIAYYFYGTKQ